MSENNEYKEFVKNNNECNSKNDIPKILLSKEDFNTLINFLKKSTKPNYSLIKAIEEYKKYLKINK